MVFRSGDGKETSALDFREKAPLAGFRDMYLDANGNVIDKKSQRGHQAAGVPGTVDGCLKMYQKYSKLKDWKKLVQPAIDLARYGYAITEIEAKGLNSNKKDFTAFSTKPTAFVKTDGTDWKKGDILIQAELAHTLELVRDKASRTRYLPVGDVGTRCRDFCFDNGLIMRAVGDTLIVAPALVMTRAEIDDLVERARLCLDLTAKALGLHV